MSGICDKESNYSKLFGTPERAARTMAGKCCDCCECVIADECNAKECLLSINDDKAKVKLLEWLKGKAVDEPDTIRNEFMDSGMLTAKQVREAIEKRFDFDVWVPNGRWQAITDELNANLGSDRKAELQAVLNKATGNWAKADKLARDLWEKVSHCPDYPTPPCMTESICEQIRNLPDVEQDPMLGVRITKTATNNLMYPDYMTKWYELSCGHSMTLKGSEPPRFCPRCGNVVIQGV